MKKIYQRPKLNACLVLFLLLAVLFWNCLPQPLFSEPVSTVMFDRNGKLLGAKIANDHQWRFPEVEYLPEKYLKALIEFEDKRFYSHIGFDPIALIRAVYLNIKHQRVVSGASTISMQVIRLSRKNRERSYAEKIIEIIMAMRLELSHSKEDILKLYASYAPFGGNVVGLDAAAWRYFGRGSEELTWAESSMLAVLPNNPSLIHPGRNRDALRAKRNRLLKKLYSKGGLNELEFKLAEFEPLPEKPVSLPRVAPHLLETMVAQWSNISARLHTTLDQNLQLKLEDEVRTHAELLESQGINNIAAMVVDNENAHVIAYIGNSQSSVLKHNGAAVDIIQRSRSTGSTLKPLLFSAMIQSGDILPETLVPDIPSQYSGYMPENYDRQYRGAVPAQVALARSLNVPAVAMLYRYGVDRFYDFLKNMGMRTLFRKPDGYGLTLILGGAEGSLWDITAMYSNLAFIAKQAAVYPGMKYRKLILLQNQSTSTDRTSDIGPAAAWSTINALIEVNRPGNEGFWRQFSSSQKIAWKTGTSYGLRDAWAIGLTPKYTVGVWAGNASGEGRPELTGTAAAAPLMFDIFDKLDVGPWFEKPTHLMKKVEVCKNDGYLANGNCDSKWLRVPKEAHFSKTSPHNHRVHLDKTGRWRVHSRCESVDQMQLKNWFILPPSQAYYYRQTSLAYKKLPAYRDDCQSFVASEGKQSPIELLYPSVGAKLYIPVDLASKRSRIVFDAVHRNPSSTLFWHLNEKYLGATTVFHQQSLDIEPGKHTIILVDEMGNRMSRRFEILSKQAQ